VVGVPGTAEIAFVVEEDYHGRGLASRLLRHLARVARDQGVTTFEADVLAGNAPMQAVFERTGWPTRKRREGDTVHVSMTLPGGGD
jgi:GNAT superfamily N-acetyltransferase